MATDGLRRLIVNADDFGRSPEINQAIFRAHEKGILTSASLMVNEASCAEAVTWARTNPSCGVGLHLSLVCGKSALGPDVIPGLTNSEQSLPDNAVSAGFQFYFNGSLKKQLRAEMDEQFARFKATGLPLDHVNGHLNIHLHPVVFEILMENAERWRIRHLRLTYDPFWLSLKIARGNYFYRASHAVIYRILSIRARATLFERRIGHTDRVFGLLQNGRVDEAYLLQLLDRLPPGDSELYSHPSLTTFRPELEALVSPRVVDAIKQKGIALIRYQDLSWENCSSS